MKQIRESVLQKVVSGHRVEVNTVDQYQGRDKSVILYCCVRSGVTQVEVSLGVNLYRYTDRYLGTSALGVRLLLRPMQEIQC